MPSHQTPLLRLHWPRSLQPPQGAPTALQLLGRSQSGDPLYELVVVNGAAAAATPASASGGGGGSEAAVVGSLLLDASAEPPGSSSAAGPTIVLLPTQRPGGSLPVLLAPPPADRSHGERRRSARQAQQRQDQQQAWDCQVFLYDRASDLPQLQGSDDAPGGSRSTSASQRTAADGRRRRLRRLAATLAPHLLAALLACLLLARGSAMAALACASGARLAEAAARQVAWLATAQPAGVKLHRQLCELLGYACLQYLHTLRHLLAGRGHALATAATAVLAAALAGRGLAGGLAMLQRLLWLLGLPAAIPYAALAGLYRWQLRCTAAMWDVMRGKQRMPLLRQRAAAWLRRHVRHGSGTGAGHPGAPASPRAAALSSFALSTGAGLKQLSGSMLLFMPLLLLLPTTAAFYGLALALHAACAAPRLAAALAAHLAGGSPAAADAGQLARPASDCGAAMGPGAAATPAAAAAVDYRLLSVEFEAAALAAAPPAVRCAALQTTYLLACRRRGMPQWGAAMQAAAAGAAASCSDAGPGAVALAALQGRTLWLGWAL